MGLIGNQLENAGWLQGSVVKSSDVPIVLKIIGMDYDDGLVLLVASQSCDIANDNTTLDPNVELSVARKIDSANGNYSHNKNPRVLHTNITCRTTDADVYAPCNLELRAYEKTSIPKEAFKGLSPDPDRVLENGLLMGYVAWLAARYSRPALPTRFNDLINAGDPKNKLREKAKKAGQQLIGIYVDIMPDTEIKDDEFYSVNMLGLLPAEFIGDPSMAQSVIDAYAEVMSGAGMDVVATLSTEDQISIATIKRFKRFYYDDLSIKEQAPLPPETQNIS